jgi:hypothetical protein
MNKPLPHIPRKYIKPNGKVDLWDVLIERGPVRVEFTTLLAREALARDPDRFKFDLPKGVKPGELQLEADERARADAESDDTEPPDPVYGRKQA